MFQSGQQTMAARRAGPGLQQGAKLGTASNWGFGPPPNLRGGGAGLDLSDFPSLSGNQNQTAQPSAASNLWGNNPTLRTAPPPQQPQQPSIQRPQQQPPQQQPQQQNQEQDAPYGGEDYRFGNQGVGQLGGQPQTNDVEEFPPLGGLGPMGPGGDAAIDRRLNLNAGSNFDVRSPTVGSERNGINNIMPPGLSAHRQPSLRDASNSFSQQPPQRQQQVPGLYPQTSQQQPIGQHGDAAQQQQPQQQLQPAADHMTSPSSIAPKQTPQAQQQQQPQIDGSRRRLADMAPSDRFSMPGLLVQIQSECLDYSPFATGQDLTLLGLDLNRPDNEPLYETFGTPFLPNGNVRPMIPEFTLPSAYTVTNVPHLSSKIASFSDDTLFAIFYGEAGSWNQEVAAQELYRRDWRWHKDLTQWMQKDLSVAPPRRVSDKQEHGFYVFWNQHTWRREKRDFMLTYDDLDQSHGGAAVGA